MAEKKSGKTPRRRTYDQTFPRLADEQSKPRRRGASRPTLDEIERMFSQLSPDDQDKVLATLHARAFRRRTSSRN